MVESKIGYVLVLLSLCKRVGVNGDLQMGCVRQQGAAAVWRAGEIRLTVSSLISLVGRIFSLTGTFSYRHILACQRV